MFSSKVTVTVFVVNAKSLYSVDGSIESGPEEVQEWKGGT